jgi:hypothetical protein
MIPFTRWIGTLIFSASATWRDERVAAEERQGVSRLDERLAALLRRQELTTALLDRLPTALPSCPARPVSTR